MRAILLTWAFLSALAMVLAGCGEMNLLHQVRFTQEPQFADAQVRFRAVYYFRVFDVCERAGGPADSEAQGGNHNVQDVFVTKSGGRLQLLKDSLYRFTMTGKAHASNQVLFESGTLPAWQIDPLGATARFSAEAGGFYVQTQAERQAAARRGETRRELATLLDERKALAVTLKDDDPVAYQKMAALYDKAIEARIAELGPAAGGAPTTPPANTGAPTTPPANNETTATPTCGNAEFRRGFQVMGPEGLRTFDQDERLILAMASTGKPVIGLLQQTASHLLNRDPSEAEQAVPVLKAQNQLILAERALDQAIAGAKSGADVVGDVLAQLR